MLVFGRAGVAVRRAVTIGSSAVLRDVFAVVVKEFANPHKVFVDCYVRPFRQ